MSGIVGKYVIYRVNDKRCSWGIVKSETDIEVTGVDEKSLPYGEDQQFSARKKDLVAVLGVRPEFGSAYGCAIEPYLKTIESPTWGSIHFFYKLEPKDLTALKEGMLKVAKLLKKHGLLGILPLDVEIRRGKGKYTGKYKHFSDPQKRDRLLLHPKLWENTPFLVAHECGHGVWFQLMSAKQRARWIKAYHSYLSVGECDAQTVKTLREDFCGQQEERVSDFRGQLAEDVAPVFDLCISHITDYHGLTIRNIDNLVDAGSGSSLRSMWPTSKVLKTDYEYPVSEYAMESPEEFFAESFAFHLLGHTLPKRIKQLMDKTLQECGGRKSFKT